MYGYVVLPKKTLSIEDYTLFDAFYCGLCIRTGKLMGQRARLTTNYDVTFLNILIHDLRSEDVKFETTKCISNPFKKRHIVTSELLDKVIAANVILSYYKAEDGVIDREGLKYRIARSSLKGAYRLAKAMAPEIDDIVGAKYEQLRLLEKAGETGIDRVSDAFASMMSLVAGDLLGDKANEDSLKLVYNIGKYVYLMDALDDIDEDHKAKRYNPFLAGHTYSAQFIKDNYDEISFIVNVTINRAIECFNNLIFTQSYDLLRKIVHIGLRQKAALVLGLQSEEKPLPAAPVTQTPDSPKKDI